MLDKPDTSADVLAGRERERQQRESRRRRKAGLRSRRYVLPDRTSEKLIDALVYYERLTEAEASDQDRVDEEIGKLGAMLLGWFGETSLRDRPPDASIQNGLSRSLISQNFLPESDTNRRFRRTLRHKRFFGASDTTADQRAGRHLFEEENRATFLPQRQGASAKVVPACAQK